MTEPHWTQISAALLTPTVAILGIYIAWRQWKTAQDRLKHDLFEKRFSVYESTRKFIASIVQTGKAKDEKIHEFLYGTREAKWLFDEKIASYLDDEIWSNAVDLQTLDAELEGVPVSDERTENVKKQRKLKKWLVDQEKNIDKKFAPFLKLKH